MPPEDRDAAFLWDMLDAAQTVLQVTAGADHDAYMRNRMMQLAVERLIEIIGEAARKVSSEFQTAHPEIAWRPIMAQRHVLAHDYGAIQQDRIWRVVTVHIPELIAQLQPLIPPRPNG